MTTALTAADLVAAVPGLPETVIDVSVNDFRRVPGASLTFADVLSLSAEVDRAVTDGAAGVVITQGTDTIEETSHLLDLLYSGDAPLVVTGAMRYTPSPARTGPPTCLRRSRPP